MAEFRPHANGLLRTVASDFKEEVAFLEEKLRKRLFALGAGGRGHIPCKRVKSFLRSFFTKKRPLSF